MSARSTKSAIDWLRRGAFGALVAMAFQAPACGGMVIDSSRERGDASVPGQGGYGPFGSGAGSDQPSTGAAPAKGGPPIASCGNGQIDPGEGCDGNQLNGATCAAVTMGMRPAGVIYCSSACTLDTSKCMTANYATGGVTGAGGFYGTGGARAVDACYASSGVPVPSGCAYGTAATDQCLSRTSQASGMCVQSCSCNLCPGPYTRCVLDGGCGWIFNCAQSTGCSSLGECYKTACGSIIDLAGGLNSVGAHYADAALSCMAQYGCPLSCAPGPLK
jgi:hypothetical protein